MALSAAEISRVLQEIAPAILGGTVQKIFQPAEEVITLEIHKRRRTVLLLLSADPDMGRIHLLSRRPLNPPGPPDFCQFLRARLEGGRLVGLEQWCGDRLRELQKAIKTTTRRLEGLTGDLTKVARYREYGRYGELLKGHLHTIAKGQDRIAVVDYFEAGLPEIVLPLDPAKDTHGNMQDYFRKYRKHLAAEGQIRPRLEDAEKELQALVAERRQLERGEWQPVTPDGPGAPRTKLRSLNPSATRREGKTPGPFRRFISAE